MKKIITYAEKKEMVSRARRRVWKFWKYFLFLSVVDLIITSINLKYLNHGIATLSFWLLFAVIFSLIAAVAIHINYIVTINNENKGYGIIYN